MNEVVVTGYGIVSPLGVGVPRFREGLFAGRSGVVNIRGNRVAETFPIPYAALVPPEQLPSSDDENDFWRFSRLAGEEAISSIPPSLPFDALVFGSAEGIHFDLVRRALRDGTADGFPWAETRAESTLQVLARMLEERGHGAMAEERQIVLNTACATGNQAIGLAFHRLRAGQWTRALVGAVDARCEAFNLMNFFLLGAVSTADVPPEKASRPFSVDRSGFVRGEGAAALVLETRQSAEERGAKILGVIRGAANTNDGYRLTDGRPDGAAVIRAMQGALQDAGLAANAVDAVAAHGTSTKLNDALETKAIKSVFGETRARKVPVTALKSQVGHATVAAGAMQTIACLLMLQNQRLAPTLNYRPGDPDCDLDYVPRESRAAELNLMLSHSFGFGGQNSCLLIGREQP